MICSRLALTLFNKPKPVPLNSAKILILNSKKLRVSRVSSVLASTHAVSTIMSTTKSTRSGGTRGRQKIKIEVEPEEVSSEYFSQDVPVKKGTRMKHSPEPEVKVKPDPDSLEKKSKWEPNDWQAVLENIKNMRSGNDAPVDSMGCERTMEDDVDPKTKRFQTLVSLMLSSQTKDPITYAAMQRLQKEIGLNIPTILKTEERAIEEAISKVSFFRRKATYIKKTTQILRDKYDDDIPDTVEGLCSLPGVGPKMAHICMNVAWDQNTGIGVDTHVHRIANRLRWSGPKETKTPEKTREGLESWLDPSLWQEINILLVGFGQTICTAVNPKCSECLNNKLCPFGKTQLRSIEGGKEGKKKGGKGKAKDEVSDEESDETSEYF